MTTRKDHLVQLVAGLGSWTPNEDKVEHAVALLAEIEKVCPEEAERLARLFCTAPELLEALTMVRDADADCVRDGLPRWCTDVARAKIDAAIAKAEGES